MNIIEFFDSNFIGESISGADYKLCKYKDDVYLGYDKEGNVSVVLKSSGTGINPLIQKTKMITLECNMLVKYILDNVEQNDIVHIIKCATSSKKERDIFLELSVLLVEEGKHTEEGILDVFKTLVLFFTNRNDYSDNELTGLYGELYTIKKFHNVLSIDKYWQSQDKMKFDFSVSDKLKIEIKSTTKQIRIHHFKHEQLIADSYDVYIVSYLFRRDDEGLSLYDLIEYCKELYKNDVNKSIKLNLVIKNVSIDRLKDFKFNAIYTNDNCKIFKGTDVPRFNEFTPDGVANAEYDCDLETAVSVNENDFIEEIKKHIN